MNIVILTALTPSTASAYAGLGPIIPMVGSGIVLLFVFGMTALGLVLHPLKMLLMKRKQKQTKSVSDTHAQ